MQFYNPGSVVFLVKDGGIPAAGLGLEGDAALQLAALDQGARVFVPGDRHLQLHRAGGNPAGRPLGNPKLRGVPGVEYLRYNSLLAPDFSVGAGQPLHIEVEGRRLGILLQKAFCNPAGAPPRLPQQQKDAENTACERQGTFQRGEGPIHKVHEILPFCGSFLCFYYTAMEQKREEGRRFIGRPVCRLVASAVSPDNSGRPARREGSAPPRKSGCPARCGRGLPLPSGS